MVSTGFRPHTAVSRERAFSLGVGAIVLAAFGVRVFHLGAMGLEFDEAFSVQASFLDWDRLFALLATSEPHPPFYYSFLKLWHPLVGTGEFALRFASVAASVLTIAFLARIARWFGWYLPGLIAAALFATNPYQIWYAQEVRMYAPLALFGAAAVYFGLCALRRPGVANLALSVAATALCLATHYYGIFLWGFVSLIVAAGIVVQKDAPLSLRRWLGLQVIVASLFLLWLVYASEVGLHYVRAIPNPQAEISLVEDSLRKYSLGWSMPREREASLSLGFLAVVAAGLLGAVSLKGRLPAWFRLLFVAGYLLFPLALALVVSLFRSMLAANYLMVSAPAFYLLLGLGVVRLGRSALPLGLAAAAFLFGAQGVSVHDYFVDPQYNKAELADAIRYVDQHLRPGDAIVLDGPGQATQFWYYHTLRDQNPAPAYTFPLDGPAPEERVPFAVDEIMAKHQGVWLLDYGVKEYDARRVVETYLARTYYQAFYQPIFHNRVVYYASAPPTQPTVVTVGESCNDQILLENVASDAGPVRAGAIVPVAVTWQARGDARRDYVVSWRLLDAAGHTVLSHDSEPAAGFAPSSTWTSGEEVIDRVGLTLPPFLPPGSYTLAVVVYDKASGAVCQFRHGETVRPGILLPLASVDVAPGPPVPSLLVPSPTHPTQIDLGGLTFLGYDLDPGPYRPGDMAALRLYWRVREPVAVDDDVRVRLIGDDGAALADEQLRLGAPAFPTSHWESGRSVAVYVDVPIPPRATTGSYRLSLVLRGARWSQELLPDAPRLPVVGRERTFEVPRIAYSRPTSFDGLIDLLGYDLQPTPSAPLRRGERLALTLYWRDVRPVDRSYKVFTHLVGPDGKIYGQSDSVPLAGNAPTSSWVPGEILTDRYDLAVAPTAPLGTYELSVGFYDPENGERLPLLDRSGDSFTLLRLDLTS